MSQSDRFRELERRLKEIKDHFIPETRKDGQYTIEEMDSIRAYILLAHAEIESYFEDIAEKLADAAHHSWKLNHKSNDVIMSLLAYTKVHFGNTPEKLIYMINGAEFATVENRMGKSLHVFKETLKGNNGIREKNILSILLPIGIQHHDIDETWLVAIDTFGKDRGDIAHKSAKVVQQITDPVNVVNNVKKIEEGLKALDEKLVSLNSSLVP
jgi:hypothetical protein